MRLLSNLLFGLAAILAALAAFAYVYLHGMACSFMANSNGCSIAAPWQLGAEDFRIMVLIPWGTVLLLVAAATILRRRAKI